MLWTPQHRDLVLTVNGITLIFGLPANLLALFIFIQKIRRRATPLDVLLLSLTSSDLIFLLFLPFRMKEAADLKWSLPYFLCPLSGFVFYTTIYNSTFLLTAVSVERYLGVAFPIKYKLKRHPRNAAIASAVFWVVSMSHCSIVYIMQYYRHQNETHPDPSQKEVCYEEFSTEQLTVLLPVRLELFLVLFLVPFAVCLFCYANFILILSRLPSINPRKRNRAIGLALATLLVFVVCFLPYNASHVVGFVGGYSPDWRVYALLTSTFNTCLDPFIFYFSSSALREVVNHFLARLVRRVPFCSCPGVLDCHRVNCTVTEESTQSSNDSSR